jgi:hypothetical protein
MLFKIFNRIETWRNLEAALGPISCSTDPNAIVSVLDGMLAAGERIYSAAYIMPAPAFGHARKHANHIALLNRMMNDDAVEEIAKAGSLRRVYEILKRYPGIGPFLAFQYAIDLNYSDLLDHDEASFVIAGPGALDGIAKCFASTGGLSPNELIHWICDEQEHLLASSGLTFKSLFGRRLQPIDCQNLFCEISKYARVAHPDAVGRSGRTRIKQAYRLNPAPLPTPKFPPRWGLEIDLEALRRARAPCDNSPLALTA